MAMSKQLPVDPLPHFKSLAAAVRSEGQPEATFRALDVAMKGVIGHKIMTVLIYHEELQETERFYSSNLEAYPIAGRKQVRPTSWTEQLLIGQNCYIGNNAADIRRFFLDHELINSLGCDAILNVPVVWNGITLGTCNLMHEEDWYEESDAEIAMAIVSVAASAYLQVSG